MSPTDGFHLVIAHHVPGRGLAINRVAGELIPFAKKHDYSLVPSATVRPRRLAQAACATARADFCLDHANFSLWLEIYPLLQR